MKTALRRCRVWLADVLPPQVRAPRVEFSLPLVIFVGLLFVGATCLAVGTVTWTGDSATLLIASLVVFVGASCTVRTSGGVDLSWTSSIFVHLAASITLGPVGSLAAALAQAAGNQLRMRPGWFRTVFNLSDYFLADIAAWFVFTRLLGRGDGVFWGALCATAAGVANGVVNFGLLAIVIALASHRQSKALPVFSQAFGSALAYNLGYGWAAFGALLLHKFAGAIGFTTTLLPVILLQGFLVALARRIRAQEAERAEHAKEREALLQQAIEASDAERKRIASDLHDGVVQTLAGLAFSLAARGAGKEPDPLLAEAANTLRSSVTDLRTLMIEIAPPDLAVTGVDTALKKLLEPLPAKGIEVEFDAATATHLPPDKTSLVFRVAQEAIRNVVNHSQATKVITTLRYGDGKVTLNVKDNGKGFSAADRTRRREEGHVGLSLLNNAVEASSGQLRLESAPGQGTSLLLELPC